MKKIFIIKVIYLIMCFSNLIAQELETPFIIAYDGIVPGISYARNVRALYGDGYRVDSLGESGSIVYSSEDGKFIFTFILGTDGLIENLIIHKGLKAPFDIIKNDWSKVPNIIPIEAEWTITLFGCDKNTIMKNFGKPDPNVSTKNEWWYPNPVDQISFGSLVMRFENNKVNELELIGNSSE